MRSEHAEHFGSEAARETAAHLGMWIFLVSEVLLFTVMFTAYALYRSDYYAVFHLGRRHMELGLGTANTYVLVTSSVVVELAVKQARAGARKTAAALLGFACLFGVAFLVIKGVEYARHIREGALPGAHYHLESFREPGASLFFSLYWLMTGVHALHVTAGIAVLASAAVMALKGKVTPLELGGMYWHLVDVIWLFLWPLFYLV